MQKPVVFISSVVRNLRSTRKKVKETLETSLSYKVTTSETEGSYASSSVSTCKRLARDCDIYIGIFGQKYGTIVPRLSISFTEMEFYEAYKDNPEKILIYIQTGTREPRQEKFLAKVKDASSGYFGRSPFQKDEELISGIKEDLANFVKERLDLVRQKGLKVVRRVTPSRNDYTHTSRNNRANKMIRDALDIALGKGFILKQKICSEWNPGVSYIWHSRFDLPIQPRWESSSSDPTATLACPFFVCSKRLRNKVVWFLVFAFPENFKAQYINYLRWLFGWIGRVEYLSSGKEVALNKFFYSKNIFCLFLIHEKATKQSVRGLGNVCFKTEGGIYVGEPISAFPSKIETESLHKAPKHLMFTSGIKNKTTMDLKIADMLHWLNSLDF